MALKVLMLVVFGIANLILGNYIISKNSLINKIQKPKLLTSRKILRFEFVSNCYVILKPAYELFKWASSTTLPQGVLNRMLT